MGIKYPGLLIFLLPALISSASGAIYVENASVFNFSLNTTSTGLNNSIDSVQPRIFTENIDSMLGPNLSKPSLELNNSLNIVRPRIFTEHIDSIIGPNLTNPSLELNNSLNAVRPRIFTEHVDSILIQKLNVTSPELDNSLIQVKPRIFIESADMLWFKPLVNPSTTELIMNETSSSTNTSFETIIDQNATMNTSIRGDFNGTLNFTNLEFVFINSGFFTGKGFSKGNWAADIEGISYEGNWEGMLFKKPEQKEIYLKGTVSGGLKGVIEGYLIESVNGSGVHDRYQATWIISQIGNDMVFAKLDLNGTINYQKSIEYSSDLYALQTSVEGVASGYYNGSLSIILTHVRINNNTSPYYGQGLSIISYVSKSGSGEGWTYDKLVLPGREELKGLFIGPLFGIVRATLDETKTPRTLSVTTERVDIGLSPAPDLKVKIWGPGRVSPGQKVNYIIEYRNDGLKRAENVSLVMSLPYNVTYASATGGGVYLSKSDEINWNLGNIPPRTLGQVAVSGTIKWGLATNTIIEPIGNIPKVKIDIQVDPTVNIIYDVLNATDHSFDAKISVSNASESGIIYSNLTIATANEWKEPKIQIIEDFDFVTIIYDMTGEGHSLSSKIFMPKASANGIIYSNHTIATVNELNEPKFGISNEIGWPELLNILEIVKKFFKTRDNSVAEEKEQNFLKWLLIKDKISQGDYEDLSGLITAERGGQSLLSMAPSEGDYISDSVNKIFDDNKVNLAYIGRAIVSYAVEHSGKDYGSYKSAYDEEYKAYLKDRDTSFDTDSTQSQVIVARDPNIMHGLEGFISPGQTLNYTIEYENEGEGIAFGVYFIDTLDEDLDDSTMQIGPIISKKDGSILAPTGTYNPLTRTITWFVGEVGSREGGLANLTVNARSDAEEGTEIINYATVYFPSVPETTRTNGIVSIVDITPPRYSNISQSSFAVTAGEYVKFYAYWQDGVQLNHSWLEINESGKWQNISMQLSGNDEWSNFTILTTQKGVDCWRIHANDIAGNENVTPIQCFNVQPDTIPPHSITNLSLLATGTTWLNFTWLNPPDPDFNHTELYLNGTFLTNVYAPQNYYNITGLNSDTSYELGTHTVDTSGNINETWVNKTVKTAPASSAPIHVTNPSVSPAIILNDNGRARPPGTNISLLNVTVTGDISSVTIDLSPIGGSATASLTRIQGTNNYTITTNATSGINLTNNLVVNATDTSGNFNNSVSIPLTVLLRGDIVRDNKIDLKDLLFLRRYLAGLEPSIDPLVADIQPAEGERKIDLKDLLFLRRYLAGLEPLI